MFRSLLLREIISQMNPARKSWRGFQKYILQYSTPALQDVGISIASLKACLSLLGSTGNPSSYVESIPII